MPKSLFLDFWPKYGKWTKINVQNENSGQNLGKTGLFIPHSLGHGGKKDLMEGKKSSTHTFFGHFSKMSKEVFVEIWK